MALEKQSEFNGLIKAIFKGGKVNKINWGAGGGAGVGWNAWTDKQKLEFAMELAAAMNQAADVLQNERNDLLAQLEVAKVQVDGAQKALEIQKAIVMTTLTEDNELKDTYIKDIQRLNAEVKALKAQVAGG